MTDIFVNVYDLHPSNTAFNLVGLGVYHSGVEIQGVETTFGYTEQGSGVFEHEPRQAPGATYRSDTLMGSYRSHGALTAATMFSERRFGWAPPAYTRHRYKRYTVMPAGSKMSSLWAMEGNG